MSKTDQLWIAAFALGFFISFGVFNPTPGIGLFIGVNALVAALWYFGSKNAESKEIKATTESALLWKILTGFYVALSVPYLYRLDYSIVGVLVAFHVLFLFLGSLYFALPSALHILDILSLIISPIALGLNWLVETVKSFFELFKGNANVVRLLLKVVLYTAASLIVFIFFAKLLSTADPEFKLRIDKILESLDLVIVMQKTLIAVIMSFIVAGLLTIVGFMKALPMFGATTERAKELFDKAYSFVFSKRSDAVLPIIVTTPLLFLFALYVSVQFSYLFGKDINEILTTYSFATYAHRGFAELLVVSMLSYPLLAWSMGQSRSQWKWPRLVTLFINSGIVSMLVIMLYSLVMRINLYVQVYGPSVLRTYVIIGAIFVGLAVLVYEILAVAKTYKPDFALFHGRLLNDYVVAALITVLGLMVTLSYYPWSRSVAAQLMTQYDESGKIDVFQLMELPLEAQDQVYQFGQTLQTDGLEEAGLLLQAAAIRNVEQYRTQRTDSVFPLIFGINANQGMLYKTVPDNQEKEASKKFADAISRRIEATKESFGLALETNNFVSARSYFDPEMKNNDIAGFAENFFITRVPSIEVTKSYDLAMYSPADAFLSGSKAEYTSLVYKTNRNGLVNKNESTVSLTFGFRNGKVVIVDSTIILAYLPDAVSADGDSGNVGMYGYRTYCKTPTLETIYSAGMGCSDEAMTKDEYGMTRPYVDPEMYSERPMGDFLKSDFVTEPKE
jgi:hypothetical protein